MVSLRIWLLAARPKTLIASIAPVFLASTLAWHMKAFQAMPACLCLLFGVLCQIAANWINDLSDFHRGADHAGRIGPKRMVSSGEIHPQAMKRAVFLLLTVAFLVGLGLIPWGGWKLLIVGLASILAACLYSAGPFPLAYYGLGDVIDFLFFGCVATLGTFYIQVGSISKEAWLVSMGVGSVINNILVVNNMRDAEGDSLVGKRTLVVCLGRKFAFNFYRFCGLLALLVPVLLYAYFGYGPWVLLPLGIYFYFWHLQKCLFFAHKKEEWAQVFEGTAKFVFFYTGLLGLGIILS